MTTVAEIAEIMESRFPPALAEDWDVNGLSVGDPGAEVSRVLFAVDPTLAVIDEAIEVGAQLLVTHHPLMLRGVTGVATTSTKGAVVHRLISHGIALYNAHTNADAAAGGVCDALAEALGISSPMPLVPSAGDAAQGTGRIGMLPGPTTLAEFAQHVAEVLPATHHGVRVAGDPDGLVTTVAVVGGSGDSFLDTVRHSGADAYVTADLRHHPASDARELAALGDGRPYLIDVSHYASEWAWLTAAAEHVADAAAVDAVVSTLNTDPWTARYGA
ncbi:Nif3-like dinuclear metal center hexameric protein [Demequina muriae]|uniref:GTP cyclohydrolase 1 type 2 homolog n=1 Tax=Demequina muriae TaxID=3051664 RepID=A0ABT8GJ97_9MICO|nr:Nif3-like dinuclear metal center hexameric protein [Demequina sp. EGI L300058]MDN4481502.1 Nif3-like dinuclear metal center hexameric protein [Demequina sp. EGI L300058]